MNRLKVPVDERATFKILLI